AARDRSAPLGLLAVLAAVLAGLGHPSGLLMLFALGAFAATEVWRDPDLRASLRTPWVAGVLTAALVTVAAWGLPTVWHHAEDEKPNVSVVHLAQPFAWFLQPPCAVAAIGGGCVMALRAPLRDTLFLGAWIVGPAVALVLVGSTMMRVTAQYGLVFLPAIL